MRPWREVAVPPMDIRKGQLDESVFAADLSDVVADRGPLEYRDAVTFFKKTYPTQGLMRLLSTVLCRLAGQGGGDPVIQIQTPFGGGKTHSLIALYHLLRQGAQLTHLDVVREVLQRAGIPEVPEAEVVVFVGTAADPLKGRTPWGELAFQLGRYELLQEHDQKRRAPGKDLLHTLLATRPTLILMDEIAEYAVKAKDDRDQVVAFFQELTETVKVLPQCVLVVTLPSSAPYGEEGSRALHQLQQVFKRVESIQTPVEGEEVYEVIRRRLFEDAVSLQEARRTAERFFEMYGHLGDDVPREVREPAYRDRMVKTYPFHPELIDLLLERWITFPDFQRTRGVLRLLAQIVSDLYQKDHAAPLIQPAHIPLDNSSIRGELLRHIGNEYEGVIAADIAGPTAKAERIDREMGSEYARFGVAGGLARAIFFASFSGGEKRGVGIQRLRLAVLRPEMPSAVVGDALGRLEDELWYLHVEGGSYWFFNQPNLNRVMVEKEEAVKPEQITEEIRIRLERLAGKEMRVILWPQFSQDVPDTRELKLVLLSPEQTQQRSATATFIQELLERCGQPFRTYRNTLLVLAANDHELYALNRHIKRFLAYRAIQDDKALMRGLSEENRKWLGDKMKESQSGIAHQLLNVYRHLARAHEEGLRWFDLGLLMVGEKPTLAGRVRDYLREEEILLRRIPPKRVLEKALRADEKEKPVEEIYETFLRYPNLPVLESEQVLLEAIVQGVQEGVFGVRIGEQVYFKERIAPSQLEEGAVLVRDPQVTSPPPAAERPAESPVVELLPGGLREAVAAEASYAAPSARPVITYRLKVNLPWDKLSEFVRGVVTPLHSEGAELTVEIELEARSASGIRPATLDQKVRETLKQIGATLVREEAE